MYLIHISIHLALFLGFHDLEIWYIILDHFSINCIRTLEAIKYCMEVVQAAWGCEAKW